MGGGVPTLLARLTRLVGAGIVFAIGFAHKLMFGGGEDGKGDEDESEREFHRCG